MKNRRNYYRILHLQPGAPTAIVKASYHTLMRRLRMHPDLGGDHAQAVIINEAFEVLSDPVRREAYDRAIAQAVERQRAPATWTPADDDRPEVAPEPPVCEFCGVRLRAVTRWPDGTCPACGSPLCPARRYQDGEVSRRAIERVPRHMAIRFRRSTAMQKTWSSTTEDVSLNGMRFLSPVAVATGERVSIDCAFCLAVGLVKSVRQDALDPRSRWRCGVEYLTLHIKHDRGGLFSTTA